MSINANREQSRLAKTEELIKDLERKLANNANDQKLIKQDWESLSQQIGVLDAKKRAMIESKKNAQARLDAEKDITFAEATDEQKIQTGLDLDQIKAADESLKDYEAQHTILYNQRIEVWNGICNKVEALDAERTTINLKRFTAMENQTAQQAALITKEQTYPQRLARHLRKCKRFGWADGWLAKAKK